MKNKPNKKINTDNFELRPKKQAAAQSCRLFRRYEPIRKKHDL